VCVWVCVSSGIVQTWIVGERDELVNKSQIN